MVGVHDAENVVASEAIRHVDRFVVLVVGVRERLAPVDGLAVDRQRVLVAGRDVRAGALNLAGHRDRPPETGKVSVLVAAPGPTDPRRVPVVGSEQSHFPRRGVAPRAGPAGRVPHPDRPMVALAGGQRWAVVLDRRTIGAPLARIPHVRRSWSEQFGSRGDEDAKRRLTGAPTVRFYPPPENRVRLVDAEWVVCVLRSEIDRPIAHGRPSNGGG